MLAPGFLRHECLNKTRLSFEPSASGVSGNSETFDVGEEKDSTAIRIFLYAMTLNVLNLEEK